MAIPTGAGPRPPRGGIVVGVDGSPGSVAALRWAIREASARGRAVHAVTAWEVPTEVEGPGLDADGPAPTVEFTLLASQYDRSERTDGRGHVSGGDA